MGVTMPFRRLEPFGVEVDRDLAGAFAPSEAYHLRQLFRDHGLIVARGQSLSMARQREICALLGPILDRSGETGIMSNEGGGPSSSALAWHCDAAYTHHPFDALSLHALDVVGDASVTRFVHAAHAWASLPHELRDAVAGIEQEMIAPAYDRLGGRTCDDPDPRAQKRGRMPTMMTNPHNGQHCLWVGEMQTTRLFGMGRDESRALLHRLFDHFYRAEAVLEHRWRTGDLVIWDNIALQHSRPDLGEAGRRILQRVIVGTHGVAPHVPG